MNLVQHKLTKAEWDNVEVAETEEETFVQQIIIQGYNESNIRKNKAQTLFSFFKVDQTSEMDLYLYIEFIEPLVKKMCKKNNISYTKKESSTN